MNNLINNIVEITENKWIRITIVANLSLLTLWGGLELLKLALGA